MRRGFAVDDGVALHFHDTHLARVVSSRPDGRAYQVEQVGNEVFEAALEVSYLAAPVSIDRAVAAA
jgi:hypothetical protein